MVALRMIIKLIKSIIILRWLAFAFNHSLTICLSMPAKSLESNSGDKTLATKNV